MSGLGAGGATRPGEITAAGEGLVAPSDVTGSAGACGAMALPSSADDTKRELWRAAALHQHRDLVPVDVVRDSLSQQPRDPQPGELCHPPFMHQQGVIVDDFVVGDLARRSW